MNIMKRNGKEVPYDITKIIRAMEKAGKSAGEISGINVIPQEVLKRMASDITNVVENLPHMASVEEIQEIVEITMMKSQYFVAAQKYIRYRYKRGQVRSSNTTDDKILSLIERNNEEIKQENSNKNPIMNSTQRDYMAGEVSKDLTESFLYTLNRSRD